MMARPVDVRREAVVAVASKRPDLLTLAAFTLTILLGGSNSVAIRISLVELPPFWGAAVRFAGAALVLFALALAGRLALPRGGALLLTLLYGAVGQGLSFAFINWGLLRVPAGLAQIALALIPLFTLFFAIAQGLERFRWRGLLGATLAVGGIAVAFSQQLGVAVPLVSLLALVVGASCTAQGIIFAKRIPAAHPITTSAIAMSAGAFVLLVISRVAGERWVTPARPATWGALAYLVFAGTAAAFMLFLFVLGRWNASATTYQFVLFPFVTIAVAAWLAHEGVTPVVVAGGALVLAGVLIGALSSSKAPVTVAGELRQKLETS